jgi:hypothetical protein
MFGYAAPVRPAGGPAPGAPQPGPPQPGPPRPGTAPVGPPAGYPAPSAGPQAGYPAPSAPPAAAPYTPPGAPPAQGGFGGQPPQPAGQYPGAPGQQPGGYGQPPAQGGYPGAPQPGGYGQPPAQGGYGQPPAQGGYGQPPAQGGYPGSPAAPAQGGYPGAPQQGGYPGAPQQGGYPGAPQQGGYPGAPAQGGYPGAPQQGAYGHQPAPAPGGYGQPGGYGAPAQGGYPGAPAQGGYGAPPAGGYGHQATPPAFAPPPGNQPGPLDDFARRIPQSQPGTLFGIPLATLRDPQLQRKALFFLGVALIVSIFVPVMFSPLTFAFKGNMFRGLVWPALAGGAYLLVAAAPPDLRAKVPPVVLQWLPFGVSYAGVVLTGLGLTIPGSGAYTALYPIGMATLIFGLLARLQNPEDQIARFIIVAGAACLLVPFIDQATVAFSFSHKPALAIVHDLIFFVVLLIAVACAVFVVPANKLPPALRTVDAFAPAITAVLLAWLVVQPVLMALAFLLDSSMRSAIGVVPIILILARSLLTLLAYFGVLMLTAPAAYDAIMDNFKKGAGGAPPPGQLPPGGGYPPAGGGYPPQGGYPPAGGGYPPQGGYPPGGGYPPQGGGGWPQQ